MHSKVNAFAHTDQPDSGAWITDIKPASVDEFDLVSALPALQVTRFRGLSGTAGQQVDRLWPVLAQELADAPTYPTKEACPLFRLTTSSNASAAAGARMVSAYGLIGEHDEGTLTLAEAALRLHQAGICAVFYTSASHTEQRPRWRVVVPFSRPVPAARYKEMTDWLNGALLGALAHESWDENRRWFWGRVKGAPFDTATVEGVCLDLAVLCPSFDPIGRPDKGSGRTDFGSPRVGEAPELERAITIGRASNQTMDHIVDALRSIPADDRDTWIEIGHALASLKESEQEAAARMAWIDWSRTSEKWCEDDADRWDGFQTRDLTYLSVFHLAEQHGWKNPAKASLETERERSLRIGREGEHRVPTQRVMSGSEMLEELVFLADGARVAFLHEPRFAQPFNEFKHFSAASVDTVEGKNASRKVHRAALWLEHPERKTVRTQTFAPGRGPICENPDGDIALNTWRPRVAAAPSNWSDIAAPFFEHVAYLVPDERERERFLDWLAHIEQEPGTLPHSHYLLVAKQTGIGRNWLAYALARCFAGYTALGFDLAESLRSGFNGALSQRLLAVVDELHEGGPGASTRAGAEKLKSLLTEATRRINPKYGRVTTEFNACRFLLFSNHEAALPLAENDRRVVVLENPAARQSPDYYAKLYRLLNEPGLGASLAEAFRRRDISRFNPGEIAPMNAAKARTIRAGRSEMEAAIRDLAADWPSDCITSGSLQLAVQFALGGRIGSTQGTCVAAGLVKYDGRVKVAGSAAHVWILRNSSKWSGARPAEVAAEVLRGEDQERAAEFA